MSVFGFITSSRDYINGRFNPKYSLGTLAGTGHEVCGSVRNSISQKEVRQNLLYTLLEAELWRGVQFQLLAPSRRMLVIVLLRSPPDQGEENLYCRIRD